MGLCGSLFNLNDRRRSPTRVSAPGNVQRRALDGSHWGTLAPDVQRFAPWHAVYDQTQRWLKAGVFEDMVHDLRQLLRLAEGRNPEPSAAIVDSRTLQSTPESGARAGYDGAKRNKGNTKCM